MHLTKDTFGELSGLIVVFMAHSGFLLARFGVLPPAHHIRYADKW